jgi:hypothetical protein
MIRLRHFYKSLSIVAGAAFASQFVGACSASSGSGKMGGPFASGSGGSPGVVDNVGAAGMAMSGPGPIVANGGEGTTFNPFPTPGSGGVAAGPPDAGCPAIRQKPEQVTIYKPVALFIMQDRTGSMVSGFPSGCACSWQNSTDALTAFVNDPASAGLDVGLGFFGGSDKTTCDGSDCGQSVVAIEPIAMASQPIISAMGSNAPNPANITPLECGLRGMIDACLVYSSQSPIGERCVAVLVTDGNTMDPTPCDGTVSDLVQIVADGKSKGVDTYTLGLQGSSGGVQQFVAALNSIRSQIAIAAPLPCTWKVPSVPVGSTFDPNKVNVEFIPPGGAPQTFGHVNSEADCAQANGNAWYYDNPTDPAHATEVIACKNACDGTLHGATTGEVDVIFGCQTIPATIR